MNFAASQLNGGRVIGSTHSYRPTILGRSSLFQRFGEQEEAALNEFEFLNNFSTSNSDLELPKQCENEMTNKENKSNEKKKVDLQYESINLIKQKTQIQNIQYGKSSEKNCNPLTSKQKQNLSIIKLHESGKVRQSTSNILNNQKSKKNTNLVVVKPMESKHLDIPSSRRVCSSNDVDGNEEIVCEGEMGVDTRSLCTVKAAIQRLNSKNQISGIQKPASCINNFVKSASKKDSVNDKDNKSSEITCKTRSHNNSFHSLDDNNKTNVNSKQSCTNLVTISSRTPSPKVKYKQKVTKVFEVSKSVSGKSKPQDKSDSTTRIPKIYSSPNSSKRIVDMESNPGVSSKDEHQSKIISRDASLPPKGSPTRHKDKNTRFLKGFSSRANAAKSPRLSRLRLNSKDSCNTSQNDPLDIFNGKSLCDSGSSEGSDRMGGRLSLSDSCAENFSPVESGDEVFNK